MRKKNELSKRHYALIGVSLPFAAGLIFLFASDVHAPVPSTPTVTPQAEQKPVYVRRVPPYVKAAYATMNTAGSEQRLSRIIELARKTELNALVVDVKGSGGELAFDMFDVGAVVERLHKENIWAIARIVVFQDSGAVVRVPDAVLRLTGGGVWRDNRGFAWLDPAAEHGWEYLFTISKRALDAGFDEINFDYIRFPSDGKLDQAVYPAWKKDEPRHEVIARFARAARETLKAHAPDMQLSIDIFGYTFLTSGDLGIGQRLEELIEPFDFVYPMTYPSHYQSGNFGFANPAEHPYEVIKGTLEKGLERFGEKGVVYASKIRPWLQAFDLGARYTPDKMRAQMQGTYDALGDKSTGWLLWDPSNTYDDGEAYLEKE